MGLNLKIIHLLNNHILKNFKVNFTFFNTVNKKNLKVRLNKRRILNRYDKFDYKFYDNVQKGYLKLFSKRKNSMLINSNLSQEKNKDIIRNKVLQLINFK